jgi:NAD(P)H-hydrate epimerase
MTAPLAEGLATLAKSKTVVAIGPGLGQGSEAAAVLAEAATLLQPVVLDADALVGPPHMPAGAVRVLTPHPGEMARLTGRTTAEVQTDRIGIARTFAVEHHVTLVLKGAAHRDRVPRRPRLDQSHRTPALGTGGTGDVLTGITAGLLAQFPDRATRPSPAAVYLHGLAGQIGARTPRRKEPDRHRTSSSFCRAPWRECAALPDHV